MEKLILIKYGELTTKGENRNVFINMLVKNIKNVLSGCNYKIKKDRVRMYIESSDDIDVIASKLKYVFGIHGIVICHRVNTNTEDIKAKVIELLKNESFKTFKVVTKRADKRFLIESMEFNNIIGGHVLKNMNVKVDVHHPDLYVNIEIRCEGTFIYTNEIEGLKGYPVGVQGKGLLMLSGGIDSPVAGYMALKRGIDIDCIYFESPPHTSVEAKNKVIKLASILDKYSYNIRLIVVPFTKIQEAIYKNGADSYMITIMRRMMYRIAEKVAINNNCKVIINGECIGQVASQTLDSIGVINSVVNMPVIRPLACFDKLEIMNIAEDIDTYATSILPYEDCCTIFLPKHPVIKPKLGICMEFEKNFNFDNLIEDCINNVEIISLKQEKSALL